MDPDSPFAHLGEGSVDDKRIGLRDIGTMLCHQCKNEWTVPVINSDAHQAGKCPVCGSLRSTLESVRRETAPRV